MSSSRFKHSTAAVITTITITITTTTAAANASSSTNSTTNNPVEWFELAYVITQQIDWIRKHHTRLNSSDTAATSIGD